MRTRETIAYIITTASVCSVPYVAGHFYHEGRKDELSHNVEVLNDVRRRLYENIRDLSPEQAKRITDYAGALGLTGDYLRGEGRKRLGIAQQDSIPGYDPLRIQDVQRVRKLLIEQAKIKIPLQDSLANGITRNSY